MMAPDRWVWAPGWPIGGNNLQLAAHVDSVFEPPRFNVLNPWPMCALVRYSG
jgi:hypothetical protein